MVENCGRITYSYHLERPFVLDQLLQLGLEPTEAEMANPYKWRDAASVGKAGYLIGSFERLCLNNQGMYYLPPC